MKIKKETKGMIFTSWDTFYVFTDFPPVLCSWLTLGVMICVVFTVFGEALVTIEK